MNDMTTQFADWAWPQFWQTTVVAATALLIARLLRRRHPHLAYIVLLLIFIKCLTPPVWSSPLGLFSRAIGRDARPQQTVAEITNHPTPSFAPPIDFERSAPPVAATDDSIVTVRETTTTEEPISASTFIFFMWAAGAVTYAVFVGIKTFRHWRAIRKSSQPATGQLAAWHEQLARKIGIKRPVRLWVSTQQHGPSCFGVFFPVIVLPAETVDGLSRESIEPVLAHELIHIRRGDTLVGFVQVPWPERKKEPAIHRAGVRVAKLPLLRGGGVAT